MPPRHAPSYSLYTPLQISAKQSMTSRVLNIFQAIMRTALICKRVCVSSAAGARNASFVSILFTFSWIDVTKYAGVM